MKAWLLVLLVAVSLSASGWAHAQSAWSAADYDLHPGDFNGDGLTDLLYISKDPSRPSGIVLSDGAGLNTSLQTWGNAYLGIPWTDGTYNIIVADFDGDGKADILLQRKTPGDSYLLLTEDGGVGAISQTISYNAAGITWTADQHQIIAGDFNGDGRADLFFQSTDAKGLSAVILADSNGQFTAKAPSQSWNDGYAGLNWASNEVLVYAGDFDGDGRSDLLVQAYPMSGTGPGTAVPAQFQPNSNGVLLAQAGKQLFALTGLQAWSRDGFGADWSPLDSVVVVGDFNADGRSDVFLQGATSNNPNYLLCGHSPGPIFAAGVALKSATGGSADTYRLMAGQFTNDKGSGLYYQSLSAKQANFMARLNGGAMVVTQSDASLPASTSLLTPATPFAPSAPAALTATSAGRTPGQFAVSAMGAATYQIPIWTPPGARGIEPHLALTYASGSPDGMMGPGWNLSGLSSINRCNKTFADNAGQPAAVTLTTSDDFCLDGNRLRLVTGYTPYCTGGATYMTEIANFSLVSSCGTAGNGPSYFVVQGKDGLIYEYGNTADSKAYATGGSTPYSWLLNKVRDRQTQADNLIWTYSTTSGALRPATIQYTQTPSTNGTTYPHTVSFTYQARVTNLSKFVAGGNIQQSQILGKINVQSGGASVRQYIMTYVTAPTTQRDRLSSIQECAGSAGTDCLRPTTISYQNGTAGVASPTILTGHSGTVLGIHTADFNGDGRLDLVYATGSGNPYTYTWWVQLASGTGYGAAISTGLVTTDQSSVLFDDFDGDGKDDILGVVSGIWTAYRWNGTGFTATSTGIAVDPQIVTTGYGAASADTDGDGLPDLVWLSQSPGSNTVYVMIRRNTSTGGAISFSSTASVGYQGVSTDPPQIVGKNGYPQSAIRHMDFNGDGRDDLIFSHTNARGTTNANLLLSNGGTLGLATSTFLPQDSASYFVPVRWNDDACTDLAYFGVTDSGTPGIIITACDGNPSATEITGFPVGNTIAMDWDGDGRTDVLVDVSGTWTVYRSLGTSMASGASTGISYGTSIWVVTDQNGDGLTDLSSVDTSNGNAISLRLHNGANTPADLATTITDGWNISASPTYVPATQSNYTEGTGAVFPEMDFIGPMYVVSQASQSDGLGGTFSNTFWYYGARFSRQGRGFEGFTTTRSQDSRNQIYQYVYYNQAFPLTGTVLERDSYQPDGSTLIAKAANVFAVIDLGAVGCALTTTNANSQCFPYVQQNKSTIYEISTGHPLIQTSVANLTYDTSGNVTVASSTVTDNDPNSPNYNASWVSTVTNTIAPDTTNWCLDKPTRTTTQNVVPGQTAQTRTLDHTVDAVKCRVTSETIEPLSATLKAVSTFGFDTCGNVTSVAIVGVNPDGSTMPTRTTTSSYGTRCTFIESITNALSQTSTTAYNYSYGVKSSGTDFNNASISWGYDNFARQTSESRPDGTSTLWSYADCITSTCWSVTDNLRLQTTVTQRDTASATVRVGHRYSDGFDRTKYSDVQRVLGTVTNNRTTYDSLGRKVDVYLPYSTASNGYHHLGYDLLDRPTTDALHNSAGATDRTTSMVYAGLMTTFTDARGNKTWKWMDVAGRLRKVVDPDPVNGTVQGASTSYTYDPFGNLNAIVDATGAQSTYTYNIRGFKTDTFDTDTGHWVFTPNSLNELVTEVDAKGQSTKMGYDLLGRLISRLEPESPTATVWTYGTSAVAHEIGRLKNVTKPDGYKEDYTFDSIGRPATAKYTEDVAYTVSYAYNSIGAVDTVTYPASIGTAFALKYIYSYGALQQLKDNTAGTVFWSLSSVNDLSSPLTEVLGNGISVTSSYTPWTNDLVTRKEGTTSVPNSLQDLAYQWDVNGNLRQRQDLKQSLTEFFTNDTMNRLSSSSLNGTGNLTVSYDAAGDINSKGDVGAYDYTTAQTGCSYYSYAQPHAVRKAGTGVYCYDANGNMTSRQGGALTWTSYNLPNSIAFGSNSSTFNYNASHQRWKQDANYAGTHEVTYYVGGIMQKTTRGTGATEYRHLISAGSGEVIVTRRSDMSNSTYYVTTDHLGSSDVVMDSAGSVLSKESFTPFGARRGSNWQGIPTTADYSVFGSTTRKGFTGHEMLDAVSLIHMDGRVYDPFLGRFCSPDDTIQSLAVSASVNRYSYAWNSPLTYVDPNGHGVVSAGLVALLRVNGPAPVASIVAPLNGRRPYTALGQANQMTSGFVGRLRGSFAGTEFLTASELSQQSASQISGTTGVRARGSSAAAVYAGNMGSATSSDYPVAATISMYGGNGAAYTTTISPDGITYTFTAAPGWGWNPDVIAAAVASQDASELTHEITSAYQQGDDLVKTITWDTSQQKFTYEDPNSQNALVESQPMQPLTEEDLPLPNGVGMPTADDFGPYIPPNFGPDNSDVNNCGGGNGANDDTSDQGKCGGGK